MKSALWEVCRKNRRTGNLRCVCLYIKCLRRISNEGSALKNPILCDNKKWMYLLVFSQKWDSKGTVSLWRVWAEPNMNHRVSDTFFHDDAQSLPFQLLFLQTAVTHISPFWISAKMSPPISFISRAQI